MAADRGGQLQKFQDLTAAAACGHERSTWDLGGVRWKAAGTKRIWGRCTGRGERGWHTLYRRDQTSPPTGA
jgi:hypothetical protein